ELQGCATGHVDSPGAIAAAVELQDAAADIDVPALLKVSLRYSVPGPAALVNTPLAVLIKVASGPDASATAKSPCTNQLPLLAMVAPTSLSRLPGPCQVTLPLVVRL